MPTARALRSGGRADHGRSPENALRNEHEGCCVDLVGCMGRDCLAVVLGGCSSIRESVARPRQPKGRDIAVSTSLLHCTRQTAHNSVWFVGQARFWPGTQSTSRPPLSLA